MDTNKHEFISRADFGVRRHVAAFESAGVSAHSKTPPKLRVEDGALFIRVRCWALSVERFFMLHRATGPNPSRPARDRDGEESRRFRPENVHR